MIDRQRKIPFNIKWNNKKQHKEYSGMDKTTNSLVKQGKFTVDEQDFESRNAVGIFLKDGEFKLDVDTHDLNLLTDEWREFVSERLAKKDTLIIKTHKGWHIFLKSDLPISSKQTFTQFIDSVTGGTICPIEYSGNDEHISYEVYCDADTKTLDDDDDISASLPIKTTVEGADDFTLDDIRPKMTVEQVTDHLSFIQPNMARQDWMELMGSAFKAVGGAMGIENVLREWSKQDKSYENGSEFDRVYKQLVNGEFGADLGASKMISWAIKSKVKKTIKRIKKAEDIATAEATFEHKGWLKEPLIYGNDNINTIVDAYMKKGKELDVKVNRKYVKAIVLKAKTLEDVKDARIELQDYGVAVTADKYMIYNEAIGKISEKATKGKVVDYLVKETGITRKVLNSVLDDLSINISETVYRTDFTQKEKVRFYTKPHPTRFELDNILEIVINPLANIQEIDFDMDIIDEYCDGVWGGELDDIIKLLAWTIKFEDKKNLIGIVAPSNTGKTGIGKFLGAPVIMFKHFVAGLDSGSKGLSKADIEGMSRNGIVVVDEFDHTLPDEMKDNDGGMTFYQFGAGGGRKEVPLKLSILTSTHDNMFSMADDEIVNRCLICKPKSKHTIKQGAEYIKDGVKYKEQTSAYLKWKFKEAFLTEVTYKEFEEHQKRYEIGLGDLGDLMETVREDVIREVIDEAKSGVDFRYSSAQGVYGVKNKRILKGIISNHLSHYEGQLMNINGKIAELLSELIPDGQRIKIDGVRYVKTNIKQENEVDETLDFDELKDF